MELEKEIQDKVDLLNRIFSELKAPLIFENADFSIDESSHRYYLKFKLNNSGRNLVPMQIHLAKDGIQLDLDSIHEIFEWGNKEIEEEKADVICFIKRIFTSYVLMEYCGSHTDMCLFDSNGLFIKKYNLTTSVGGYIDGVLKRNCHQRLYLPIYSPTELS